MRYLLPLTFAALLAAAGCSKDKDVEPPAALVNFPATLPVKKLWDEGVGGGKKQINLRLGLGPAIDKGLVFAASHKGEVVAVSVGMMTTDAVEEVEEEPEEAVTKIVMADEVSPT